MIRHERSIADVLVYAFAAFTIVLLVAIGVHGCTPTIRQQAINVGNSVTRVSDTETKGMLAAYCRQQMRALGHPASYEGGRCTRTDTDVPASSASPDQITALANVRSAWAPVLAAHERFIQAHNTLAGLVNAGVLASDAQYLAALSQLAEAYEALRQASHTVNHTLPALLGGN